MNKSGYYPAEISTYDVCPQMMTSDDTNDTRRTMQDLHLCQNELKKKAKNWSSDLSSKKVKQLKVIETLIPANQARSFTIHHSGPGGKQSQIQLVQEMISSNLILGCYTFTNWAVKELPEPVRWIGLELGDVTRIWTKESGIIPLCWPNCEPILTVSSSGMQKSSQELNFLINWFHWPQFNFNFCHDIKRSCRRQCMP